MRRGVTAVLFSPTGTTRKIVRAFGSRVGGIITAGTPGAPRIPGKLPLQARILPEGSARFFAKIPEPDPETCTGCGICVKLCPAGAIDETTFTADDAVCIRCFACSNFCPQKARSKEYRNAWLIKRVLNHTNRSLPDPVFFVS